MNLSSTGLKGLIGNEMLRLVNENRPPETYANPSTLKLSDLYGLEVVGQIKIEDIEIAYGMKDRPNRTYGGENEKQGFAKTVNDQNNRDIYRNFLVNTESVDDGVVKIYLSRYIQRQNYSGAYSGTGLPTAFYNTLQTLGAYKLSCYGSSIERYNADGSVRGLGWREKIEYASLVANSIPGGISGKFANLIGYSADITYHFRTASGTEFTKTYQFLFLDGEVERFAPEDYD